MLRPCPSQRRLGSLFAAHIAGKKSFRLRFRSNWRSLLLSSGTRGRGLACVGLLPSSRLLRCSKRHRPNRPISGIESRMLRAETLRAWFSPVNTVLAVSVRSRPTGPEACLASAGSILNHLLHATESGEEPSHKMGVESEWGRSPDGFRMLVNVST